MGACGSTDQQDEKMTAKIPPHSREAERAILGAMLFDTEAAAKVFEILPERGVGYCYFEQNRIVLDVIAELYENSAPIDIITVAEKLKGDKKLESAGGAGYLTELVESVVTAANVEEYARIVADKYVRRRLISTAAEIGTIAFDESENSHEALDKSEQLIYDISAGSQRGGFVHVSSELSSTLSLLQELQKQKRKISGVESGFIDLDKMTSGFQNSDLVIVAGRPSMGKTAFCLNISQFVAIERNMPVAIFSLEMSTSALTKRLLASEARVDQQKMRGGYLNSEEWRNISSAVAILSEAPIFIDDSSSLTVMEMRSRARRLKSKENVGLIMIDYMQMMSAGTGRYENRQQEISTISRSLKALAKELDIPVVALSQLSREVEKRSGEKQRPQLSDLRESGAIEQDADVVIFINRPERNNPEIESNLAEIIIGKQRNGPTGLIPLSFIKEYTRFENLSVRDDDAEEESW